MYNRECKIHIKFKIMKIEYVNPYLGKDKDELKNLAWENQNKISALDMNAMINGDDEILKQYHILNQIHDRIHEAARAEDCGDYWEIKCLSAIRGKYPAVKIKKGENSATIVMIDNYKRIKNQIAKRAAVNPISDFWRYELVRRSGVVTMNDADSVCDIAGISIESYHDIRNNYNEYLEKEFNK